MTVCNAHMPCHEGLSCHLFRSLSERGGMRERGDLGPPVAPGGQEDRLGIPKPLSVASYGPGGCFKHPEGGGSPPGARYFYRMARRLGRTLRGRQKPCHGPVSQPPCASRRTTRPSGEWRYSARCRILSRECLGWRCAYLPSVIRYRQSLKPLLLPLLLLPPPPFNPPPSSLLPSSNPPFVHCLVNNSSSSFRLRLHLLCPPLLYFLLLLLLLLLLGPVGNSCRCHTSTPRGPAPPGPLPSRQPGVC